jgi:hypothetical protein
MNRYPIFAPEHLGNNKPKGLAAKWMEGMNDPNLLRIEGITCS